MSPAQYALSMHGEHINQLASSCILLQGARAASPARPAAHQLRAGSPSKQAAASTAAVGGTAAAGAAGAAAANAGPAGQAAAATAIEDDVTAASHAEQAAAPLAKPAQGACSKHSSARSSSPAATAMQSVPSAAAANAAQVCQPAAAAAAVEVHPHAAAVAAPPAAEVPGTAGAVATACAAEVPETAAAGAQLAAAEASRSLPAAAAAATAASQPTASVRAAATGGNSKPGSRATPAHVASPAVADAGDCMGASAALSPAGSPSAAAAASLERSSSSSSQTSHVGSAASSSRSCQQIQWPPAEPGAIAADLLFGLPSAAAAGACGSGSSCSSFVMHEGALQHAEQLADVCQLPLAQLQPHSKLAVPQQQPPASAAVTMIARVLTLCQRQLEASPEWHLRLRVCLMALRLLTVLLLLKAVLHGSIGLMVLSMGGLTANTLLSRLLGILMQPALCASLTNASELQRQLLLLLLDCAVRPLPCPHSQLLLTFESKPLEDQYRQVRAFGGTCRG